MVKKEKYFLLNSALTVIQVNLILIKNFGKVSTQIKLLNIYLKIILILYSYLWVIMQKLNKV